MVVIDDDEDRRQPKVDSTESLKVQLCELIRKAAVGLHAPQTKTSKPKKETNLFPRQNPSKRKRPTSRKAAVGPLSGLTSTSTAPT